MRAFKMKFLFFIILIGQIFAENVILIIYPERFPKFVTGDKFFSVALDTSIIAEHFLKFNMTNQKLINMVKQLRPGYLRIGGNMADRLFFVENSTNYEQISIESTFDNEIYAYDELNNSFQNYPNFTMSGQEWIKLNNFAKSVGTKILFDINCLIRNSDGSWNSENAEELISFSNNYQFDIDWQLGNEPNAFKHVFNYEVNATQLAKDFLKLRVILNKFPRYKNSLLVGPDITRPNPIHKESEKYLIKFLNGIEVNSILDVVSFHQYYLNGRNATIVDFLNPDTFDLFKEQVNIINKLVNNSKLKYKPIWLTETSSAYGGGAKGLSNTFVGSFLWLDKLGLAAKNGIKTVVRQSVYQNYYALINNNYDPTPDWWLSILFNKLVGPEVLECYTAGPNTVRLYCHCSKTSLSNKPTVIVYGINISNSTVYLTIEGMKWNQYNDFHAYILTSVHSLLTSSNVLINGHTYNLSTNGILPEILPKKVNIMSPIEMPAYSLAFLVLPSDAVKYCLTPFVSTW